tara:strand:+ start:2903 stop:3256 length:354 start_codon:yes stop_codon:yes gene_type:complete
MNFCEDCDNMLYVNIDENDVLTYKCKTCQKVYDHNINKSNCVYEETYNIDDIKKETILNKYTFDDPTLPKAKGVKCPNDNCPSKKPNIVYINYDNKNMKYIYVCLDCRKANNSSFLW